MTQPRRPYPLAPVEFWDGSRVKVRCPGCDEIHLHGFTGYQPTDQRRASHCAQTRFSCNYRLHYPFSETDGEAFANYEIDKQRAIFVTAGLDISKHFPEPVMISSRSTRTRRTDAETGRRRQRRCLYPGILFRKSSHMPWAV